VVITKMINKTNARSSNGVILISLNVTRALRWEKRRITNWFQSSSLFQILGLHLGDEFLRKIVQLDRQDAQVVHQPVVTKHRGYRDEQACDGGNQRRRNAGGHGCHSRDPL